MSTQFTLNPATLDDLAGQLETLRTAEAGTIGHQLQRINANLQQAWTGRSADAFTAAFGDWTGKWQAISGNLTLISAFLREAAQQYRELEDARNQALGATDSARWQAQAAEAPAPPGSALTGDNDRYPAAGPGDGGVPVNGSGGGSPGAGPLPGPGEQTPPLGSGSAGAMPGPSSPPPVSELPDPLLPGEQADGAAPGSRPHDPIRPRTPDYSWIFEPGPGGPLFGVPPELARHLSGEFKEWLAAHGIYLEDLGRPLTFTPEQLQLLNQIWSQYGIDLPDEALREPLTLLPEQTRRFLEWAEPATVDIPERPIVEPPLADRVGHAALIRDPQTGLYHNWRGEVVDFSNPGSSRVGDAPYLGEPLPNNGRTGDEPYLSHPGDARLTREQAQVVEAWIRANDRRGPETWPGLGAS